MGMDSGLNDVFWISMHYGWKSGQQHEHLSHIQNKLNKF